MKIRLIGTRAEIDTAIRGLATWFPVVSRSAERPAYRESGDVVRVYVELGELGAGTGAP